MTIETYEILKAIGGLAAFVAAFISWRALVSTQKNSEAGLVLEFLKEYSSAEMSESLRMLRKYKENYGDNFETKWLADLRAGKEDAQAVDLARRKVSHYFQRGHSLYSSDYVKIKFIETTMFVDGLGIFLEINKPLEIVLGASPTQGVFAFYEKICTKDYYVRKTFRKNA
jgi:hypothetical protein